MARPDTDFTKVLSVLDRSRATSLWKRGAGSEKIDANDVMQFTSLWKVIQEPDNYVILLTIFFKLN